jgi:hypothetical protein
MLSGVDTLAEISARDLQRLLGLSRQLLSKLVADGTLVRAERRGLYKLESITRYVERLRDQAAGRGFLRSRHFRRKAHPKQRPYENGEGSCEDVLS